MSIVSKTYLANGSNKIFSSDFKVLSDSHLEVTVGGVMVSKSDYDLINNAAVFNVAPALNSTVVVRVGTTPDDLLTDNTDIEIVSESIADVNTLADHINDINAIGTDISNVNEVADNMDDINTIAALGSDNLQGIVDNLDNVATVANIYPQVASVAASIDAVQTVATNIVSVNTATTNIASINTTATSIASVNTVAAGINAINTVAADLNELISEVETVANDLNEAFSEIENVSNNLTAITNVSDNMGSVLSAVTNAGIATTQAGLAISAYDSFDDRYLGTKTLDPTLDNDNNTLIEGAIYWNSSFKQMRVWSGTAWIPMSTGSGASGGGTDQVFYENDQVVTTSYTLTAGKNASSAGPITIADGVEVTVPNGSTWVII